MSKKRAFVCELCGTARGDGMHWGDIDLGYIVCVACSGYMRQNGICDLEDFRSSLQQDLKFLRGNPYYKRLLRFGVIKETGSVVFDSDRAFSVGLNGVEVHDGQGIE